MAPRNGRPAAQDMGTAAERRLDKPGPQTARSMERGFRLRGPVGDQWGFSESVDPDNVGDIADEGTGHRG